MAKWQIGVSNPLNTNNIRWTNDFVNAVTEQEAEQKAAELGYYRNVRLREVENRQLSENVRRANKLTEEMNQLIGRFNDDPNNDELRGEIIGKIAEAAYFLRQYTANT